MRYELPKLSYSYSALEPYIDARTMEIHHTKHHQAYVDKLNEALAKYPEVAAKPLEELLGNLAAVPEDIRAAVRNHGGGHLNHSLYWEVMGPNAGGEPNGALAEEIKNSFGGFDNFKEALINAGLTRFGSGWAWLVVNSGRLEVYSTPNQDSPFMEGKIPILGVDLWEHAYYLQYQWRRGDYLKNWWNVVNWQKVEENYKRAK